VELDRRIWNAALKLALAISVLAAIVATTVSAAGDVPQVAIVVPVIVVAFVTSWIQTGRAQRGQVPLRVRNTVG
jgi:fatty acid desaturase